MLTGRNRGTLNGVRFTEIPWRSTSSLWGSESDQPAELEITEYGLARVLSSEVARLRQDLRAPAALED
ncbi:MAG: hypothetical protein CL434_08940 [Acidimicrobiaceae bacterium]|nr:hypothetical protein [Acidimicrobiaceae bacterium]